MAPSDIGSWPPAEPSEGWFRSLFDHSNDAIFVLDPLADRIAAANPRARTFLGYSEAELRELRISQVHPQGMPALLRFVDEVVSQRGGWTDALSCMTKDGREVPSEISAAPVELQGRRYVVAHVRDLTDRRRAERLDRTVGYLQDELKKELGAEEVVGDSPAFRAVVERVRLVAPTDSAVLITGETGTGKELLARLVHRLSKRSQAPLIKVNCAALPATLVESELFGHERGAFTGAVAARAGRFELADGGTIFLDEVGDMPLEVQAKLLRVLQEHEFERIGGTRTLRVDARVIAATNRDLEPMVRGGTFRSDLYYRLNVFGIHAPALRERREDLPLLAHHFMLRHARRMGRHLERIHPDAQSSLSAYDWPGNVRELSNVIERSVILSPGETLTLTETLGVSAPSVTAGHRGDGARDQRSLDQVLAEVERDHIAAALEVANGLIEGPRGAARSLGLHPNTLRTRMKRLGVQRGASD